MAIIIKEREAESRMKWLRTKTDSWRLLIAPSLSFIATGILIYYLYGGTLGVGLCAGFTTTGIGIGIVAWFKGWLFENEK